MSGARGIGHLVVGIGASAGGLKALRAFLAELPAPCGITVIVAQHLSAGQEALLIDTLRPLTPLPVAQLEDGAALEPDRLLVLPAGQAMMIVGDRIRLRPHRLAERRAPIDQMLRALARGAGPCAVGVVLSGANSDGTLGLGMVAAGGGLAMAQAPETADYADMPESARSGGQLDHVAPPDELARRLLAHARHIRELPREADAVARHRAVHAALPQVADALKRATGNDFRQYKPSTMMRRLERRMQVLQIADIDVYLERLTADEAEARALFRELLIGVTSFFRDPDAFRALADKALGPLMRDRASGDELRIWVPGCATGEEAYSIAMLAREIADTLPHPPRVQIFATDIDERALSVARRGSYPQGIAAALGEARLNRFFTRHGRRWQIAPELREMCLFSVHNLVSDPPFSRLDLISCRNLLIYMGPHLQKKLFPVFHYALKPGGCLFLGASESMAGHAALFRALDAKSRLAVRKNVRGAQPGGLREFGGQGVAGLKLPDQMAEPDLGQIAQRVLLTEFAPRFAVVNEKGVALHLSEGADKYLQAPVGSFTGTITRLARRGLSAGLRSAFEESARHKRAVSRELPAVQTNEGLQRVRLTVQPLPELGHGEGLFLVVFQYAGAVSPSRAGGEARPDAETVIEALEGELARAREELERAVQDQEASNEELKSSNEELLSMNEELQSANEELEASKEEVQGAARALEQANADLENLLRSTRIATLFLDAGGRIRSFTPAAAELYYLREADRGRPLIELSHRLIDLPPLPAAADGIAEDVAEDVAQHEDGRWFLRRVLTPRDADGAVDGQVVTFVDITTQKKVEADLRRAATVIDNMGEGFIVLDRELRVVRVNNEGLRIDGRPAEQIVGRPLLEVWPEVERLPTLPAYRRALETGEAQEVLYRHASDVHDVWLEVRAYPVGDELAVFYRDVTDRQRAREEADRADKTLRAMMEAVPNVLFVKDRDGRMVMANRMCCEVIGKPLDQLIGRRDDEFLADPAQGAAIVETDQRIMASGVAEQVEEPVRTGDGTPKLWLSSKAPLFDANGAVIGLVGAATDITERKATEEALAEATARLNAFVEAVPGVVYAKDCDGRMMVANRGTEALVGKPLADMLGRTDAEFLEDKAQAAVVMANDRRIMDAGRAEQVEERVDFADGRHAVWLSTKAPLRDADGRVVGLIGSSVDITERRRVEAALAASEAQFRTIANALPQMVWAVAADGAYDFFNDRWHDYTGMPRDLPADAVQPWVETAVHPDDQPAAWASWRRSLETGDTFEAEYRLRRADGEWRWVLGRAAPVRDDDGRATRWLGSSTDIHDQKQSEERLAEALKVSDVLLHEVNHRVKNSLQVVTSLLMLQAGSANDPQLKQALMDARGRVAVVASMHQRLYSSSQHDRVDFGEYLTDMAAETLRTLDAGGRITLDGRVQSDVIVPLTQAVPLALVTSELVTNALKYAFPGGGRGTLLLSLQREGDGVRIVVGDDGVGLPDGFDPARSGGLGMRIVGALVRQVRGTLAIERGAGGARFTIMVPLA